MKVLGISGLGHDAAAAIVVDGRIVAAVSEESQRRPSTDGSDSEGVPSAAVRACLDAARLQLSDLDTIGHVSEPGVMASVDDGLRGLEDLPTHAVEPAHADALQAAASVRAPVVLVCSARPSVMAPFLEQHGTLVPQRPICGADELFRAAGTVARTLGMSGRYPYADLAQLSTGAEPEFLQGFEKVLTWNGEQVVVHNERLRDVLQDASADTSAMTIATTPSIRMQQTRRAIAVSFTCRLADLFCDAAAHVRRQTGGNSLVLAGGVFANARLNSELRRRMPGEVVVASLPEAQGRAIGAALAASTDRQHPLGHLALGPSYSNLEIKRVLDNCRLDYVYEPDWQRVIARVSKMLAQGKVVAWFQGAMSFGPRALGTRSVLCDPSNRYARYNVNEFYRQLSLDEPLPLVVAPSAVSRGLIAPGDSVFPLFDTSVDAIWRDKLVSALDSRQCVRVHSMPSDQAPELQRLLEYHYERTGVPALIETNLSGPGQPADCTPREAIRTVYSSAIDALVIGNFVLMKDHWLLRSDVQ